MKIHYVFFRESDSGKLQHRILNALREAYPKAELSVEWNPSSGFPNLAVVTPKNETVRRAVEKLCEEYV